MIRRSGAARLALFIAGVLGGSWPPSAAAQPAMTGR
jgi:hypothetical protein